MSPTPSTSARTSIRRERVDVADDTQAPGPRCGGHSEPGPTGASTSPMRDPCRDSGRGEATVKDQPEPCQTSGDAGQSWLVPPRDRLQPQVIRGRLTTHPSATDCSSL